MTSPAVSTNDNGYRPIPSMYMYNLAKSVVLSSRLRSIRVLLVLLGMIALWLTFGVDITLAQTIPPDSACKLCHIGNENEIELPSGEVLSLDANISALDASVHGIHAPESVYCTDCHTDSQHYQFPHEPNPAQNLDEFRAEIQPNCERCHTSIEAHNPGHLQALDNPNVPGCIDCHGGHDVAPVEAFRSDPVAFCTSCHQSIGGEKLNEMHQQFITDMQPGQSCEDCHGPVALTENDQCVACHTFLDGTITLDSGDTISLSVSTETIHNSVHGDREYQGVHYDALECVDCHKEQAQTGFPHEPVTATTQREYTVAMESVCQDCHVDIAASHQNDIHQLAIEEGNLDAATCIDCHGSHDVQIPNEPRQKIDETCGECHTEVFDQYRHSVHGEALYNGVEDVPVCIDCHGVHGIEDPLTPRFRVNSPEMCGECHADKDLMAKHGISTDVFDTYVSDFHGTTVTLFEKISPDQETNKAVCFDCHGVHNILPVTDENSKVIKQNLLETCRECHPNASDNFPDAWMSHYVPSLEHNRLVFFINKFYQILIPLVIGGFLVFIGTDVFRRFRNRKGEDKSE